jgi:hypothetical protein
MATGLGWRAYFWLPALIERRCTRALEGFCVEVSPFHLRFLALRGLFGPPEAVDARAANPALPFIPGIVIVALAGAGLVATVFHPKPGGPPSFLAYCPCWSSL